MKILYVALKYDHGVIERGLGFEHYNFYDSLLKMDGGRHKIIYFPFDEILSQTGKDEMNKKLLETARAEKPDLCFFFLFTDEIYKETITEISKDMITFNWFADDHWRFDNFSKKYASAFTFFSTTDSEAVRKYAKLGFKNVIKTQWACNNFLYKPQDDPKAGFLHDVSFVGQVFGNRKRIIDSLGKKRIDVDCFGRGWPNGKISQEEMITKFSRSKINLNLTKGSDYISLASFARIFLGKNKTGIYMKSPLDWYYNFKAFLGHQRDQIKGRNFEIPGCGGFLLTSEADNLNEYYIDGEEFVIFKDIDDLAEKIKYYLENDEERKRIAEAGYERTLRDHTYEKRFDEIFKMIFK